MRTFLRASSVAVVLVTSGETHAASPRIPDTLDTVTVNVLPVMAVRPVYRVVITGDGKVDFEGIANVKKSGHSLSQLSPKDVEALSVLVGPSDFFTLAKKYRRAARQCKYWASDGLRYEISVTTHGRTDTITFDNGFGCSRKLSEAVADLAVKIVALSGVGALAGIREL